MLAKDRICYETYQETADWLLASTKHRPKVGIICGSGLGLLADALQNQDVFKYVSIPNFPQSTVQGHAGRLVFGDLRGKPCVCMQGRFHVYEGYSLAKVTFPIRVFRLLGVEILIVTNAAGSIADGYKTGDIMVIKDHINLPGFAGQHPLCGPNEDRFGPRFPSMSDAYDRGLCKLALDLSAELDCSNLMHEGVYCMVAGPNFETPAEACLLHKLGADAVGMSTAPEVVVARHCNMRVFGLSLITNEVVKECGGEEVPDHAAVLEVSRTRATLLQRLITELVARTEFSTAC